MTVDAFFYLLTGFMVGAAVGITFGPEIIDRLGKKRRDRG